MRAGAGGCSGAAFSLIEVVLAMGVLCFCLLPLLGLLPTGMSSHHSAHERALSRNVLETIMCDLSMAREAASARYQIAIPRSGTEAESVFFVDEFGSWIGAEESLPPPADPEPGSRWRVAVRLKDHAGLVCGAVSIAWPARIKVFSGANAVESFVVLDGGHR